jgi:tRNA pseudouridine38-40 synthase
MRAFRLAYDGTPYHGFQRQPDVPTVEDALFGALSELDVLDPSADAPPEYAAAGRTDAGVSALAQTVAFEAPAWLAPRALNGELPAAVRAWASTDVPAGFHATHDAAERTYVYHLHAPEASVERARAVGTRLEGTHDVHNLTPDDEGTVREVTAVDVERAGPFLDVTVRAPGFSRQQVRRTVSLLAAVARGEAGFDRVEAALSDRALTGPEGIPPAPAEPLVLADVEYPDLSFAVDEAAAESGRAVFRQRRIERLRAARVAGTVLDGV